MQRKLEHLKAADLFADTKTQVFSAKSGKWIGTIDTAGELPFDQEPEAEQPQEQPAPPNPKQINLF